MRRIFELRALLSGHSDQIECRGIVGRSRSGQRSAAKSRRLRMVDLGCGAGDVGRSNGSGSLLKL